MGDGPENLGDVSDDGFYVSVLRAMKAVHNSRNEYYSKNPFGRDLKEAEAQNGDDMEIEENPATDKVDAVSVLDRTTTNALVLNESYYHQADVS